MKAREDTQVRPGFAIAFFVVIIGFAWLFFGPNGGEPKWMAKKVQCLSNLKQVGVALAMYSNDNDDRMPASGHWMDLTQPYNKSESTLHCPVCLASSPNGDNSLLRQGYGYAMDAFLSMAKAEEITEPEQMPLVYETRQLGRNASGYLTDVPSPGRHNSQSNYLFADFHVRSH